MTRDGAELHGADCLFRRLKPPGYQLILRLQEVNGPLPALAELPSLTPLTSHPNLEMEIQAVMRSRRKKFRRRLNLLTTIAAFARTSVAASSRVKEAILR